MPDEVSLTGVARDLERAERTTASEVRRLEREHRADIERLEREHREDILRLREDVIKPLADRLAASEQRPSLTVGRMAVIATAVIALAALVVQAWGTLKGAK